MICGPCAEGGDLSAELVTLLAAPGRPKTRAVNALKRRIESAHAQCRNRCPCQHRGTGVENLPAGGRPVALVTAPTVSATPPRRRTR